jgi:rod shape-determining protein MreD
MGAEWTTRLRRMSWWVTPPVLTLALVLLGLVPTGLPYVDPVTPAFAVIAVYYWSIYRPEHLPAGVVFVLGLVQDALGGTPLGMSSLVLLAVFGLGVSQRRVFIGKSVLVEWWGFLLVGSAAVAASWVLANLFYETIIDPRPAITQAVITIAAYPCVAWLFVRAQRGLMKPA